MTAPGVGDRLAGVGIEALELFVEVLSESERGGGDDFYDRLCEAVCRLARMRRAVIFRYDGARRRVRAAGAHGLDIEQFAGAHVTVESAPIAAAALAEDRVVEVTGELTDQIPAEFAALIPEPVRFVCAPMTAAGRAMGVILADRLLSEPALDEAEQHLLWTLGKAAALASVARIVATQAEKSHQLEQRIDLAREIHERRDPTAVRSLDGARRRRRSPGAGAAAMRGRDAGRAHRSAHRAPTAARPRAAGHRDDAGGRGRAALARASRPRCNARERRGRRRARGTGAARPVGPIRGRSQRAASTRARAG